MRRPCFQSRTRAVSLGGGYLDRLHLDSDLRRLPQRVVHCAVLDHPRESLLPLWGKTWCVDCEVDFADSRRARSPRVIARNDEPICRERMPAQETFRVESDAAGEAGQKELGRGGGAVVAPIRDRLV